MVSAFFFACFSGRLRAMTVIYDLKDALAALTAGEVSGKSIHLESPPFGAQQMGASVFLALIKEATAQHPSVDFTATLDCGDEPGLALNALRLGVKSLRVQLPPEVFDKIADIAEKADAAVKNGPRS